MIDSRFHPDEPAPSALPILDGVPEGLYAALERCEYRDELVLASGDRPDRLVILVRGYLSIKQNGTAIASRAAVRLIGELAFIDGKDRSASVFAEGAVVTYELPASAVPALMSDPAFCRNLTAELAWKLREATSDRAWRYQNEVLLIGAYRSFMAPELLQELLARGDTGEPRRTDAVTLFADIRGFTAKVMVMQPDDLSRDLGAFLDLAVDVVHRHGGMVDKFIGDEVMAIWGYAPHADDAARAFAAARDLVLECRGLTLDGESLRIGVGVEAGSVTLGVVGSEGKRQFTAIGPSVNLAARLQGQTKELGVPICLGPDLVRQLPDELTATLGEPHRREIYHVGPVDVWTCDPTKE